MEKQLHKFFNTLKPNGAGANSGQPQIGFKLTYCESEKFLKVKVIGARQLPNTYGSVKPKGYSVKVTLFPEKEKFDSKTVTDSTPIFNEEFTFRLQSSRIKDDPLKDKFISFTIYANLEDVNETENKKPTNMLKRFLSFNDRDVGMVELRKKSSRSVRSSYRNSLSNRRTIGAVTYKLEIKSFNQVISGQEKSTPDVWRPIKEISSGMITQSRDGTKGSVEVTFSYALSEDRNNDVVEISVNKFRCSVQTMQEHERIGGQLYIKVTAFEREDLVQKMKSDKFEPTISLKLDPSTSTLRANIAEYNLDYVKILIRLMSRNVLGKKELLGKIEIDKNSDIWKEIVSKPLVNITKTINFE